MNINNDLNDMMANCVLCPRSCHVNRLAGDKGCCGKDNVLSIARASLHMWEEPCLTGTKGSGTVFFSGCGLRCVYCQNRSIAMGSAGISITVDRLSEIFIELQSKGAHNINLVTASHYVTHVVASLDIARSRGLCIPVVYNSGGYETVDTLRMLDGYVDIYMPDMKYMDENISAKYSAAGDYFEVASKALDEMVRQVGKPVFDLGGLMQRGVIVRHLTLPGCLEDSKNIIKYLVQTYGGSIYVSIMNQFTPVGDLSDYPELKRLITEEEYDELIDYAVEEGLENGFVQEGQTALESFIPAFDGEGVLPVQ